MKLFVQTLCIFGFLNDAIGQFANTSYSALNGSVAFNRAINTSKEIRVIEGGVNATPLGAASYSIPIVLPDGINSMQPKLSIEYNSLSGSGLLGKGWNLNGVSSISRNQKTFFIDGITSPVEFKKTDALSIDGNRLIEVNGSYKTEIEDYSEIIPVGSFAGSMSSPESFIVKTKDGITMEYGNTIDSRILSKDSKNIISWKLNKVYDVYGNYVVYEYDNYSIQNRLTQNEIKEIKYVSNDKMGVSPFFSIKFSYSFRDDNQISFVSGTRLNNILLLNSIKIETNKSELFREYTFDYGYDGIASFLNEVKLALPENSEVNSTLFKYGDVGTNKIENLFNLGCGWQEDNFIGDFNGDGYSDIITIDYRAVNVIKYCNSFKVFIYEPNATTAQKYKLRQTGYFKANATPYFLNKYPSISISDFNGDGIDDFYVNYTQVDPNGVGYYGADIYYLKDDGRSVDIQRINAPSSTNTLLSTDGKSFHTGDFNGDGNLDFLSILYNPTNKTWATYFSTPSLYLFNLPVVYTSLNDNQIVNADDIHILDFDGDGKTDFMIIKELETKILSIDNLASSGTLNLKQIYSSGYPTKYHEVYLGDFNGDRKTDIITKVKSNGLWECAYSDGLSFISAPAPFSANPNFGKIVIGDYNGDGRSDVYMYPDGRLSKLGYVYLSVGNEFKSIVIPVSTSYNDGILIPFDYNGDGKQDIYRLSEPTQWGKLSGGVTFDFETLDKGLTRVSDGFNRETEIEYGKLTGLPLNLYVNNFTNTNAIKALTLGMSVVSKIKTPDGIGGIKVIDFKYQNALFHRTGRGFLGFQKIISIDNLNNRTTENEISIASPFYSPTLLKTILSNNSGLKIKETNFSYQINSLGNKRFSIELNQSVEKDILINSTKTIGLNYDVYGNIISRVTNKNNIEVEIENNKYIAAGTQIPSKLAESEISSYRTGSPMLSYLNKYTYNSLGALASSVAYANTSCAFTTNYSYDGFGNVISTTVTGQGVASRTNSFTYDTKGRYRLSHTNPLGQTSYNTYNEITGLKETNTGVDGLTTRYEYNNSGYLISTSLPQGYDITNKYEWDIQSNGISTLYYVLTEHPGKPDSKVYYDYFDRSRVVNTETFGGAWTKSYTNYNNKGNVIETSKPYLSNETPFVTTFSYDDYNRPVTQNDNFNNNIQYSYTLVPSEGALITSITDGKGVVTSRKVDATSKVILATDAGGTLSYKYDSHGNNIEVKLGALIILKKEFDICGNQNKLIDKNAGTWSYSYNAFNELISQTNGRNQTQSYQYDNLGRIISKTLPEGTINYEYNPVGINGVNKIKKVTNFNGYIQEFSYDIYSRLIALNDKIGQKALGALYNYDIYDNEVSKTFSSGLVLSKIHDSNGYLQEIKSGSTSLYKVNALNGFGQCVSYKMGNGKTSFISYNFGRPTLFNTPALQYLAINYDNVSGNIDSRVDLIKNKTETFTYDNLNRLTASQINQSPSNSFSYLQNGNIYSKYDIGLYTYDGSKNNAVKRVTNPSGVVPNRDQQISYTSFEQPSLINENANELSLAYGSGFERKFEQLKSTNNNSIKYSRYFSNDYEKQIIPASNKEQDIHYVNGLNGLACIVVRENGTNTFYYTYKDHLGSILSITDKNASIVTEQNFDAWGRNRNPNDWSFNNISTPPDWLYRGYTGHEHLPEFNLINMNGRLYDPLLGRMLSPDNFIQEPYSTQSFNKYSYAINNPMRYIDPSGESWIDGLIASIQSSVYGASSAGSTSSYNFSSNTSSGYSSASYSGYNFNASTGTSSFSYLSYSSTAYSSYGYGFVNTNYADGTSFSAAGSFYNVNSFSSSYGNAYGVNNSQLMSSLALMGIATSESGIGLVVLGSLSVWTLSQNIDFSQVNVLDAATVNAIASASVAIAEFSDQSNSNTFKYITYTKTNLNTGYIYVGRSSGYGTPSQIASNRDASHHREPNYSPAVASTWLPAINQFGYKYRVGDPSYWAIRASEQTQIAGYRMAGISDPQINGIGSKNRLSEQYYEAAKQLFNFLK